MADVSTSEFSKLYEQLRHMAQRYRWDQDTLQPTALVHEAYLKLRVGAAWPDEMSFRAIAARAMRQVLVDHARKRNALRRGGDWQQITLSGLHDQPIPIDALDLHRALNALEQLDPRKAQIVELSFFGGLTQGEIATHLDVSVATVEREWRRARAWLSAFLNV